MSRLRDQALKALAIRYPDDYQHIYSTIRNGETVGEVTVEEWATEWLKLRSRMVRPGTFSADQAAINRWIIPSMGDKPLAGLQRGDIRAVHEAAEAAGRADSTVQRIHIVLQKMLVDAVEEGHDVPQRTLRTRKAGGAGVSPRQALSVEDARKVLEGALTRPNASRWVAALLQGMRPAEALGLRWSSVDLDRGLMTVEWQLKHLPYQVPRDRTSGFRVPRAFESIHLTGTAHLVRPKTASGVRIVPLVPWLRTELTTWSLISPRSPFDLVWTRDGNPSYASQDRAEWEAIVEEADVWVTLPDGTRRRPLLYEARHTAATLLMASGADETTLTAIVGHSKITSTRAYLHTNEARKREALAAVGTQLGVGDLVPLRRAEGATA